MTIAAVTPVVVALPLARSMKLSDGEIATADNVLVRIEAEGAVGWGEAPSAPTMTGETVEGIVAAVRYLAPALLGREARDITGAEAAMEGRLYGNASVKSAIGMALYDLNGRLAGKPVAALLGGARRRRIPVLWLLAAGETAGDAGEARAKAGEGFVGFKAKVGLGPVAEDARRAAAIRATLGDAAMLSADANQAWTADEGVAFVAAAADARLDFVEQPVHGADLVGMARIARASPTPVGADEGFHGIADIERHHALGAAAGGSFKLIKLGGLDRTLAAARVATGLGMKVNLAGKLAESSIATAALLHLAAVVPAIDWGLSLTNQYLARDVTRAPIAVAGGHATVPDGPGLGVEVDEDAIGRWARAA